MTRGRPPGARIGPWALLNSAVIALVLLTPLAGADTPTPPRQTSPVPDIAVRADSHVDRALNLSEHFAFNPGGDADYWTVRALRPPMGHAAIPVLYIDGTWLGVAASDPEWVGVTTFQLEACAVRGVEIACVISNEFFVYVTQRAPTGNATGQDPPPTILEEATAGAVRFETVFDPASEPLGEPLWFLDGEFAGQGKSLRLASLPPGEHRLVVLYATAEGSGVVYHVFAISALPPPASDLPLAFGVAGALVLLGVAVPARTRSMLLVAVVSSVHPRVAKDSLLDHFNRGALHQVIKENPGIHFSELRRRVGISHGTAIWHLRALEEAGIVRAARVGAFTTYTVTGAPLEPESYGLTPSDRAVLTIVRDAPGISLPDLAKRSERSLGTTSRAVTRLVALGFVTTQLSRRRRLIFPRPDAPAHALDMPVGQQVE